MINTEMLWEKHHKNFYWDVRGTREFLTKEDYMLLMAEVEAIIKVYEDEIEKLNKLRAEENKNDFPS